MIHEALIETENLVPCWMDCPGCDGFFCSLHETHVAYCSCPPIEEWSHSPYLPPSAEKQENERLEQENARLKEELKEIASAMDDVSTCGEMEGDEHIYCGQMIAKEMGKRFIAERSEKEAEQEIERLKEKLKSIANTQVS